MGSSTKILVSIIKLRDCCGSFENINVTAMPTTKEEKMTFIRSNNQQMENGRNNMRTAASATVVTAPYDCNRKINNKLLQHEKQQ